MGGPLPELPQSASTVISTGRAHVRGKMSLLRSALSGAEVSPPPHGYAGSWSANRHSTSYTVRTHLDTEFVGEFVSERVLIVFLLMGNEQ